MIPRVTPRHETLVAALRSIVDQAPDAELYAFTEDGDTAAERVTRAGLERRARTIAGKLQEMRAEGERAVLLYPPGIDYVAGFFGCLYAGTIAVPAYPPDPTRLHRTLPRLQAIIADCRADVVMTTAPILMMAEMLFEQAPDLRAKRWIATDTLDSGLADTYRAPVVTKDTIAFLQYTSGSTGTPKGVILSHGNLTHNEELIAHGMELDADSVVMSWLPPYHDMGLIGGILAPLYNGARAVLMSPIAFLQRPLRWMRAVSSFGATVSGGPNFAYDLAVRKTTEAERAKVDFSRWRVAFSGAEPVRVETLDRFVEAFGPSGFQRRAFYPCYGLAEGALIVSGGRVPDEPLVRHVDAALLERSRVAFVPPSADARSVIGCGATLLDQEIVLADPETCRRAEPGTVGEIWVRGGSVARGYWQRPEATAEAFGGVLADTGEGPFLRTGDLGFFDGGELFVAGRAKDVVIIRGRNHYPQDIERVAEECHPLLRRGCAAAFSYDEAGEERLALCVEVERGFDPGTAEAPSDVAKAAYAAIRNAVAETFDVRVTSIGLLKAGSIPKTSSGKIQRRETKAGFFHGGLDLVARDVLAEAPKEKAVFVAPRTETERTIAAIWAELLGVPEVGVGDDFFALGGQSLVATQAVTRVREALAVEVTLRELFESPTLGAFAEHIEAMRAEGAGRARVVLTKGPELGEFPLGLAQERLWFLEELDPGRPTYHIAALLRLEGPLDRAAFARAVAALQARHPSLRTSLVRTAEGPRQRVLAEAPSPLAERSLVGHADPESALAALVDEEVRRPFDLAHAPLLRLCLVALAEARHALVVTHHHLVSDGWSVSLLVRDLAALYVAEQGGAAARLPASPVAYTDYAAWQRAWFASGVLDKQLAFWTKALEGAAHALELPTDRPRPPAQSYRGARLPITLPKALTADLVTLARRENATLYAVLAAAYALLLARFSGQKDLLLGTPVANRARPEAEGLVGFFVNTLVLRVDASGDPTGSELVARVRDMALSALANQDVPFERLVEALAPRRDLSRSPLFQALFALQNVPLPEGRMGELVVSGHDVGTGTSKFDLSLELTEKGEVLEGFFEYATDLWDEATIARLRGAFLLLVEGLVRSPKKKVFELPMLDAAEQSRLLVEVNKTSRDYPKSALLHELFEAQASRAPERVAVVFEGHALTYGELEQRANQLAHHLRGLGVGPDVLVGLLVERGLDMVVGLFGILKAGGAYVPLDPAYPKERIAFVLEDARAPVLVTQRALAEGFGSRGEKLVLLDGDRLAIAARPSTRPERAGSSLDLAYAIYTSGSTGKPKGVGISHRALVNFVGAIHERPGLRPEDRLLAVTSLSFDIAGLELYAPLTLGASVEVASRDLSSDGALLAERLASGEITVFQATPATYRMILDAGFRGCAELVMLVGGEALPEPLAKALVGKGAALWNMYGPTETTIWSTAYEVPRETARVTLGTPLANNTVYVLDERMSPVPVGVRGELYIGGDGVARGYVGQPELTAARFVADPFAPQGSMRAAGDPPPRLYRTGDLVRFLPDGTLEFSGRLDHQVKIRGHRIELGEIESVLGAHAALREVVVVAEARGGDARLVAYYAVREGQASPAASELRAHLRRSLPEYMLPSVLAELPGLPRTPNGKIDRKALPRVEAQSSGEGAAPRTPTERALAPLWAEVLGLGSVSISDDFFELGGHSLLATKLMARVRGELGVELPLRAFFEAPTLEAFAARVDQAGSKQGENAPPPVVRVPRDRPLVPSFAQERMWVLSELEGANPAYNVSGAVRLRGALDTDALRGAFAALVQRHEALRTHFAVSSGALTQVIEPPGPIELPVTELALASEDARVRAVLEAARADANHLFDPLRGPLFRVRLLRFEGDDHALIFTLHHIVSDEWSRGVIVRDYCQLYAALREGRTPELPELPVQYADYAAWQRAWLEGPVLEEQIGYWKSRLEGAPTTCALPPDRPRSRTPTFRGERLPLVVSKDLTEKLEAFARREGLTLFMVLLAGVDVWLTRHGAGEDLVVGTPIANRARPELEGLVGFFANTLVLRVDVSGAPSFRDVCRRVKEACLGAYAHQDVPFERIVEAVAPERDPARHPVFQTLFNLLNAAATVPPMGGISMSWVPIDSGTAKFDLGMDLTAVDGELRGIAEWNLDLYDDATARRLVARFPTLLADAVQRPEVPIGDLALMTEEERSAVLAAGKGTGNKLAAIRALLQKK